MQYVIIKYRAPSIDGEHMPLYLYTEPLRVLEDNEQSICVIYKDNEFYSYWFNKKYIERYL